MLIKFTRNGSVFEIDYQGETFTKGDNNVHVVETILLFDEITPNDVGYVQFLREGEKESSPLFPMVAVDVVNPDDGTIHNGFKHTMGSSWYTDIAGTLKMTLTIKRVSENGVETTKAYGVVDIVVEDSASQEVPSTITNEEYNAMIELIVSKLAIKDYKLIDFTTATAMPISVFAQNILQHNGTIDSSKNTFLYTTYLTYTPYGETSEVQTKVFAIYNSPYVTIYTASGDAFRINTIQGNNTSGLNLGRMNINYMYVNQELDASRAVVKVNTPTELNHATPKEYVDNKFDLVPLVDVGGGYADAVALINKCCQEKENGSKSTIYFGTYGGRIINNAIVVINDEDGEFIATLYSGREVVTYDYYANEIVAEVHNKIKAKEIEVTHSISVPSPTKANDAVSLMYLMGYYYDRTHIDDTFYSKTYIDEHFSNKTELGGAYVDLTSAQTIYGAKTFANDVALYGATGAPFIGFKTTTKSNYFGFNSNDRPIVRSATDGQVPLAYTTDVNTALNQSKAYTDNAISSLIGGAPEILDTFKEIADYIASDEANYAKMLANIQSNTTAIENLNNTKADKGELFSRNYSDLIGTPDEALIIIRDSVSQDTTLVAKEIELNGVKWKTDDSGFKVYDMSVENLPYNKYYENLVLEAVKRHQEGIYGLRGLDYQGNLVVYQTSVISLEQMNVGYKFYNITMELINNSRSTKLIRIVATLTKAQWNAYESVTADDITYELFEYATKEDLNSVSVDLSNYYNIEQTNNKIDEKINASIASVLTADY